jgi:cysteine desulfurase
MKRIYLDYASLTPVDPRVLRESKKYSGVKYVNPSSLYAEGVAARKVLAEACKKVADILHALPDEIVFTSGGTEANGLALEGTARAAHRSGFAKPHLIISAIEHSSIMETAAMMEKNGVEVTRIPVDVNGVVSAEEIKKAIRPETFLVSIMYVNNEIGSIQPIRDIAKAIRQVRKSFQGQGAPESRYPLFHTDAAQAPLYVDMIVEKLGVDLLTLDGAKIYGPRGMGCLYIKRDTAIEPIIYGGGQEKGLRSGTENIPSIVGFATAMELTEKGKEKEIRRIAELRTQMSEGLIKIRPDITINSSIATPHILNVSIPGIDNEFFLFQLDAQGIAISTKSSCLRDEDESYVLKAINGSTTTSIRFSFGRWTKKGDIRSTLKIVAKLLGKQ